MKQFETEIIGYLESPVIVEDDGIKKDGMKGVVKQLLMNYPFYKNLFRRMNITKIIAITKKRIQHLWQDHFLKVGS